MVIIIGAGLSGLLTAYHLKNAGIPFKVLEARDRIGGRILTVRGKSNSPVEMGATWFNPQHQLLIKLLEELNISFFEQYMKGTAFYQPVSSVPADAIQIPQQVPSYRISGGTNLLITNLYEKLDKDDVLLNESVKKIKNRNDSVLVEANDYYQAKLVVMALPPKLWAGTIAFEPSLSDDLMGIALGTHTWMEDSIKVALVYEKPFWRGENQSGTFFSNAGPVTEFYDHCNADASKYSLCGFVNSNYKGLSIKERKNAIIDQLKMAFGEEVTSFIEYTEFIWSEDKNTFYPSKEFLFPHQNNGNPVFDKDQFDNRLLFSSTEVSPHFGGYMEGAVYLANETAKRIIQNF